MYHVISSLSHTHYSQKVINEAAKKLVDFINRGPSPFHGKLIAQIVPMYNTVNTITVASRTNSQNALAWYSTS